MEFNDFFTVAYFDEEVRALGYDCYYTDDFYWAYLAGGPL